MRVENTERAIYIYIYGVVLNSRESCDRFNGRVKAQKPISMIEMKHGNYDN